MILHRKASVRWRTCKAADLCQGHSAIHSKPVHRAQLKIERYERKMEAPEQDDEKGGSADL